MKILIKIYFFLYFICFINKSYLLSYSGDIIINIRRDINKEKYSNEQNHIHKNTPVVIRTSENLFTKGEGFGIYGQPINPHYEIAKKILKNSIKGIEGVFLYYKGNLYISNSNGQIIFPNLEHENNLEIIVTEEIIPIKSSGKIPRYFMLLDNNKYKWYKLSQKINTTEKNFTWNIEEKKSKDKKIPNNAIIIILDPNNIKFEKNIEPKINSPNLIIPDLLIENYSSLHSTFALNTLEYFSKMKTKKESFFIDKNNSNESNLNHNSSFKHDAIIYNKN